jgi:hypothetical protein
MNNKNNLKIGDKIMVEQAWEDEAGNYHDEVAEIKNIDSDGQMRLDFLEATKEVKEFLSHTDGYYANDFTKEL